LCLPFTGDMAMKKALFFWITIFINMTFANGGEALKSNKNTVINSGNISGADSVTIAGDQTAIPYEQVLSMLSVQGSRELLPNMRRLQVPEAMPGLARILRDSEKPEYIRKLAAFIMGKIGSAEARKVLIEVLEMTDEPSVEWGGSLWERLTEGVYDCIEQESEQKLLEDLQHENPHVRWCAASQLGKRKSVIAVDALIELLKDPQPNPRLGATWALGEIQDIKGIEELIAIVEKRRTGGNRLSAIEAMGKTLSPRCIEAIKSVEPNDPDYWMVEKSPVTRAEELKADLSSFKLMLKWNEPIIEKKVVYPSLVLTVPKYEGEVDWTVVKISEEQATRIIDCLLTDGYVRLATDTRGKNHWPGYARYSLGISTKGGPDISKSYDLNLEFIKQLGSLREVLYGDAAEAMDGLLEQIQRQYVIGESNALGMWGDETSDHRELWLSAKNALPEGTFFGVEAAWIDMHHATAICILFKTSSGGVEFYEYTNSYAAIVDTSAGGFCCRQLIKLWDSKEDYYKKERLSLPMHHRVLSQKWRGWPKYSHAKVAALDMDGDWDKDLVVNLWDSGGSYAGAETFVLRNNGGIYAIVLSKRGAESQRFGTKAKPINRISDLDSDGIAELMIWDEFAGPEPHSNSRCWLDIYHWDGSKMAQCNSLFPHAYEQPKNGFLEICKLYPDQTPEYYYYLGKISEYQAQIEQAVDYYEKCARCAKAPRVYIYAANERLRDIGSGIYQSSSEYKEGHKFWDHQKKPIPTVITGERATQIRHHMAALFVPCSVRERKRAEKALVELVSNYKLLENSVEADATWSSPVNFASVPGRRRSVIAFLHAGTGNDVSVWVLCEEKDVVESFSFKGSAKGCGYWQVCDDLNADGDAEIIIKHYVGNYDGAGTTAVWPAIYKWDGNSYIRADEQFPDYYAQNMVPQYERIIELHKDWRNHSNKQVRTIYEKCRFVLQKARAIVQKRHQNVDLLPVTQRIELPGLAVSLGMSVDEVAESFSNIDFTHKPEQRWQRNGHSFLKHEEITCDVVHLRRVNNQLEDARFIFENHRLVRVMLTIINVQNCLKPLVDALGLRQVGPGVYEGLNGQILMEAGDGNAEKQTWEIIRK
jgi:tetratricopeptide (TPR) repeat protein